MAAAYGMCVSSWQYVVVVALRRVESVLAVKRRGGSNAAHAGSRAEAAQAGGRACGIIGILASGHGGGEPVAAQPAACQRGHAVGVGHAPVAARKAGERRVGRGRPVSWMVDQVRVDGGEVGHPSVVGVAH